MSRSERSAYTSKLFVCVMLCVFFLFSMLNASFTKIKVSDNSVSSLYKCDHKNLNHFPDFVPV